MRLSPPLGIVVGALHEELQNSLCVRGIRISVSKKGSNERMKTFYALLIAALFTTAACNKKKDETKTEPVKTDPAAKPAEPAAPDPAAKPTEPPPPPAEPPKAEPVKAEPPPVTVEDAGAKLNALVDKVVKATKDAGADCAKLGTALKPLVEDAKVVSANDKELEKDAAKKKEFETKFEKAAEAKTKAPMKQVEKCMTNADVKAFVEALAGK